ncbi:hypothetical protein BGZ47_002504 [Haplosporangium gracile]|nr:hypothetical protein BGZ47_002504 [Haplosporangium gracile]
MTRIRDPSEEALGLLELVSHIGTFLDPPDLFSCVQVSRLWNKAAVPSLWHTVDDTEYQWPKILKAHDYPRINNGKDKNWIKATVTKYGTWIRVLSIHWGVTLEVAHFCGSCTNIHTLILSNPFKNKTTLEEQEFRANRRRELQAGPGAGLLASAMRNMVNRMSLFGGGSIAPETLGEREVTLQQREWTMTNLFHRLIQQNKDLSCVRLSSTLRDLQTVDFPASIYDTLASKGRFHVLDNYADCNDLGALLETLPYIRYYGSSSWSVSSSPFQTTLPSLQALRLQDYIDTLLFLSILQHLPNLRSLWAGGFRVATPYCKENFIHEARNNIKPTLLQLLHLGRTTPLEDEILRATIPCLPDLRDLTAGDLDETTILTIVECCRQLETVTLYADQDSAKPVPVNTLSYLLEGCPWLRVLDASRYNVEATQLEEERPWVCQDLEVLKCQIIGIEGLLHTEDVAHSAISTTSGDTSRVLMGQQSAFLMQQHSRYWQYQVYSRLAHLKKLTTLVLWLDPVLEGVGSLEFTLETGLGQLSTLTKLDVFGFDGMTSKVGPAELAWIAQSWPRLCLLYGLKPSATPMTEIDPAKDTLRAQFMALRPDSRSGLTSGVTFGLVISNNAFSSVETGGAPSNRSSATNHTYVFAEAFLSLDLEVNPPTTTNGTSSTMTRRISLQSRDSLQLAALSDTVNKFTALGASAPNWPKSHSATSGASS